MVLFIDQNEHVYDGALGKALSDREGLNLSKDILKPTSSRTGVTFLRGSKPINGLWASSNLDISIACVMPFGYRIADHGAFVLDIPLESLEMLKHYLINHLLSTILGGGCFSFSFPSRDRTTAPGCFEYKR